MHNEEATEYPQTIIIYDFKSLGEGRRLIGERWGRGERERGGKREGDDDRQ